jgi:hypothetical protein
VPQIDAGKTGILRQSFKAFFNYTLTSGEALFGDCRSKGAALYETIKPYFSEACDGYCSFRLRSKFTPMLVRNLGAICEKKGNRGLLTAQFY